MFSRPAKVLTSISSVDWGKWKLVSIALTTLNSKPGRESSSEPFGVWIDEEVSGGRACDYGSCAEPNRVFESSDCGSADSDDATRRAKSVVEGGRSVRGNCVWLGMDLVIFDALDTDRLEGSQGRRAG